jgi:predicted RNase H-like nuclease (RuvC/YqgF family)
VSSLSEKGIKTMDETTYHTWWALHLRTTRGEHLNSEEQATYEAGLRQLQQEETGDQDIVILQQTRTTVAALEAEQARLHARHEQLNAEIAALESALSERTRQLLGTQG